MVTLLPCPFCTYAPQSEWVSSDAAGSEDCGHWLIACTRCSLSQAIADDEDAAARMWNTRPDSPLPAPWLDQYTLPQLMDADLPNRLNAAAMKMPAEHHKLRYLMMIARDVIELNQRRIKELKQDLDEREEWHRRRMERHQEAATKLYAAINHEAAEAHRSRGVAMPGRGDPLSQVKALAALAMQPKGES